MTRRSREQIVIASIGFAVLLIVFGVANSTRTEPTQPCFDEETRERVRKISLEGFDAALKDHMQHLFDIWMKDDREQPKRAQTGARTGFSAYARARHAALTWNPPLCP